MSARPAIFLQLRAGSTFRGQVLFFAKNPITEAECLSSSFQTIQEFARTQRLVVDFVVDEYFKQLWFQDGRGWSIREEHLDARDPLNSAVKYLQRIQQDNF